MIGLNDDEDDMRYHTIYMVRHDVDTISALSKTK